LPYIRPYTVCVYGCGQLRCNHIVGTWHSSRVGQNRIYNIYGVCTVFSAGKLPNILSYTAYIYTVLATLHSSIHVVHRSYHTPAQVPKSRPCTIMGIHLPQSHTNLYTLHTHTHTHQEPQNLIHTHTHTLKHTHMSHPLMHVRTHQGLPFGTQH